MSAQDTTVLIIDDDSLHLTIYTWILGREGYKCRTSLVKSSSVELPVNDTVDLVLLDYRLSSSLMAIDVAEQVKGAFPSAPIVVLSELQWMPDDIRAHASAFVSKGEPHLLLQTITSVLAGKPALR